MGVYDDWARLFVYLAKQKRLPPKSEARVEAQVGFASAESLSLQREATRYTKFGFIATSLGSLLAVVAVAVSAYQLYSVLSPGEKKVVFHFSPVVEEFIREPSINFKGSLKKGLENVAYDGHNSRVSYDVSSENISVLVNNNPTSFNPIAFVKKIGMRINTYHDKDGKNAGVIVGMAATSWLKISVFSKDGSERQGVDIHLTELAKFSEIIEAINKDSMLPATTDVTSQVLDVLMSKNIESAAHYIKITYNK